MSTSSSSYLSRTLQRWRNARAVVQQIRAGEWQFVYNPWTGCCCYAHRGSYELWVGNGAFFCDTERPSSRDGAMAFGLIFRCYVWWAAAKWARRREDRRNRQERQVPDLTK